MLVECKGCGVEFDKNHWHVKRSVSHFCTRSCAAVYNNTHRPSRLKKKCKSCSCLIISQWTYCEDCRVNKRRQTDMFDESKSIAYYASKTNDMNKYRGVRLLAKRTTRLWPQICKICSYSLHVETCHIRSISSFPTDTLVSVVNADDNMILLCRNCHWEFDHGITKLGLFGFEPKTPPL